MNQEHSEKPTSLYMKCWNSIASLHPAWYISIGLSLLLAATIIHYQWRDNYRSYYSPYSQFGMGHYRINLTPSRVHDEDIWDRLDAQMRDREQRRNQMIRQMDSMIQSTETIGGNGQFTGIKSSNNSTITYNLRSTDGKVSGTISRTGSGGLDGIKNSIEKLGFTITSSSGILSINGDTIKLPELIEILKQ